RHHGTGSRAMTRDVDDRGVATLWAVGAIAVLVSMAIFGLHLGQALIARHHTEAAADLVALAGAAQVLSGGAEPCAQARRITDRMRVQLASCQLHDQDVVVEVSARPPGWPGTLGSATAQARAGPPIDPITVAAELERRASCSESVARRTCTP